MKETVIQVTNTKSKQKDKLKFSEEKQKEATEQQRMKTVQKGEVFYHRTFLCHISSLLTATAATYMFDYHSANVTVVMFSKWSRPSLTLGQVSWSPVTSHCSRRCHDTNRNRLDGS